MVPWSFTKDAEAFEVFCREDSDEASSAENGSVRVGVIDSKLADRFPGQVEGTIAM